MSHHVPAAANLMSSSTVPCATAVKAPPGRHTRSSSLRSRLGRRASSPVVVRASGDGDGESFLDKLNPLKKLKKAQESAAIEKSR